MTRGMVRTQWSVPRAGGGRGGAMVGGHTSTVSLAKGLNQQSRIGAGIDYLSDITMNVSCNAHDTSSKPF